MRIWSHDMFMVNQSNHMKQFGRNSPKRKTLPFFAIAFVRL